MAKVLIRTRKQNPGGLQITRENAWEEKTCFSLIKNKTQTVVIKIVSFFFVFL